ncbi:MAG: carboxypeptidase regulatory-like domain-containing protein [Acidobacteria bacterium]|nr:carboxypeptidase regulatory-like domain-containing protein [Acidobacteriota bacterium]MBV9185251.1 carboxypeptidase regulatory-like domain-containing protein [Acidobacteriota bacterium]
MGNLYGSVVDAHGTGLPGVTVTLSGQGLPQVQVTDAEGHFRFIGLQPGRYQIRAELEGFSTARYPNVDIAAHRDAQLEITLEPAIG